MKGTRVSYRYAKSLMSLSIEKGLLEEVYKDMLHLRDAINSSRDLEMLLKSPIVKGDKKQSILDTIFSGSFNEITANFIQIIVRKGREQYLGIIANAFTDQYKEHKNITTAEVITAIPLDDAMRNKVLDVIKSRKSVTGDVELVEKVDKDIIGGVLIRVGDQQNDATIARRLSDLKQEFHHNPYVADF